MCQYLEEETKKKAHADKKGWARGAASARGSLQVQLVWRCMAGGAAPTLA